MKRILLVSVILTTVLLSGCASSAPTLSPQLVLSINGTGDTQVGVSTRTTQTFHISNQEWYIETDCEALDSGMPVSFIISVFPEGVPIGSDFVAVISQTTPSLETNYVHKSGNFYLSIVAMNIKTWSIKAYE